MTVPSSRTASRPESGPSRGQRITPHLWFDQQAEEAVAFYTSLFDRSRIGSIARYGTEGQEIHGQPEGTAMTVDFELAGHKFIALNGGPHFQFTPAISFFVTCDTEAEVDALWQALSAGGSALMQLGRYDWSEKYGWVRDRYGLTWQIALAGPDGVGQKIVPCLMFVGEEGRAEAAMTQYVSLFDDSGIDALYRYEEGPQPQGAVMYARFRLDGETFAAMDSSPRFADSTFNEAVSLLVACDSQREVDHFWDGLTQGGDPAAQQCGWLKDRFGVSWQVSPTVLQEMLLDPDPAKVQRVTRAFLRMKKFDVRALQSAYEG